jgi:DNA-binding winged helix-turn-helix (wHTH) protein
LATQYRFDDFVLSPRRRILARGGAEQPLIPRYFDLLVFLVEHRHEAVHRRDIFDRVWSDVVVSDSALSQAVRTIRRTLGDNSREPRYIRTVSRHGYRFVFEGVAEENDDGVWPTAVLQPPAPPPDEHAPRDPFEPLLERLTAPEGGALDEEDRREAAELLHELGTVEALARLGTRPGHAMARALLRDTRWDVPAAGPVPIAGAPGSASAAVALVRLRLRRAARIVGSRWAAASIGGGMAGVVGGAVGGLTLAALPGSNAPPAMAAVLATIGGVCGALGGAGVGAGLTVAETVARSRRAVAAVCGAAAGGWLVGMLVQYVGQWSLSALVGVHVQLGGALEGSLLGGAAGLGYAMGTPGANGGLAAPRGWRRARAVGLIALACGIAALALTVTGRPLVGGTIHGIAQQSQGAQAMLTPLGYLVGEPGFGPLTRALIGIGEGALFGIGLALGLTGRMVPGVISSR